MALLTDGYLVKVNGGLVGTGQPMEDAGAIVTEIGATGSDTAFPTEQAVRESLQIYQSKNSVINGDMRRWQRGTSHNASFSDYTADRWRTARGTTTATLDVDQSTTELPSNTPFQSSMKMQPDTADASVGAADLFYLLHRIEGYNFQRFIGKTATLSFYLKSNVTGTMCIAFANTGNDRTYVSEVTISDTNWNRYSITLTFNYSGGTWDYDNGTGLQIAFNLMAGTDWQTASTDQWISVNDRATSNQTNFMSSTSNILYLTGVQLELGSVATDFDFEDESIHAERCKRYYQKSYSTDTNPGTATGIGATFLRVSDNWGSSTYHSVSMRTEMRETPTITLYDNNGNSGKVTVYNPASVHNSTGTAGAIATGGFYVYTAGVTNNGFSFQWVADAEL